VTAVNPNREIDAKIVMAIRGGDAGAYRELVEKYQSRIYAMVCGMVRDREEAHDLTQDAFVKAFKNLDRFRLEASFYTWLYRIASNLSIDWLRKQKRRKHDEFDESKAARDSTGVIDPVYQKHSPAKEMERSQLKERIFDAMETLSPEHRQIVLLREVEGYSYAEIADVMGIPEGTVMSRLFYARRKLQGLLREDMEAVS
jgi:RNA polymerase sigma-70 factor (ECF subfamily)